MRSAIAAREKRSSSAGGRPARAVAAAGSLGDGAHGGAQGVDVGVEPALAAEDGDVDVVRDVDDRAVDEPGVVVVEERELRAPARRDVGRPQASASISGRPQPSPRVGETYARQAV